MPADAAEVFEEAGSYYDTALARRLYDTIMSVGDTIDPADFPNSNIAVLSEVAPSIGESSLDFFVDGLYGGAVTPADRQAAIDVLNTDDNGVISDYTTERIQETVGFMMGFAQYTEQ